MKVRYRCLGCSFQSCEGTVVSVAVYGNGVTACAAKAFVVTVIVVVITKWIVILCLDEGVAKRRVGMNCMGRGEYAAECVGRFKLLEVATPSVDVCFPRYYSDYSLLCLLSLESFLHNIF